VGFCNYKSFIFLALPLALSAFTHIWNAVGFPDQAPDDGTYIRRALRVTAGLGPQQDTFYDHPYFGQIFLGTIFTIIGYPDSGVPSMPASVQDLERSIGTLYTIPRILMGILAVVDTFLIYKIAEHRYSRNIAFIAAILFAITPLGWLFRRMYLDPIQLPFLLTSILFALYTGIRVKQKVSEENVTAKLGEENKRTTERISGQRQGQRQRQSQVEDQVYHNYGGRMNISSQNMILLLSSGIFLGLTIFTKIPAITLIPLVGFIVFTNNKKSFRALGLWIIPVILIPLIWPIHAMSAGNMDFWLDDVIWQATERPESSLDNSFRDLLRIDPVLIVLGSVSLFYAAIRKDFFVLLWTIPFIIFFYLVGRVTYNYWVPLLPVFCISGSIFIVEVSHKITGGTGKLIGQILPFAVTLSIVIFGLIVNVMLLTVDLTSSQIQAAAYVQYQLNDQKTIENNTSLSTNGVTIISGPNYSWIFKYVFKEDNVLDNFRDRSPIDTEKYIMMTDMPYKTFLRRDNTDRSERLETLYDNTVSIAKFEGNASKYDFDKYPYFSIRQGRSGSEVDIRSSYS
jgi:Dolichyl-phosphate-mannose-protein mannosyltransferase